ncbi:hypothetical protein [Mesorhizobium sp.]|uniref:hypothetical protein n=1 Tax=Mesorhizobium sp. TaxID=1871066 RepID=UPI000FE9203D|nr:hypothetical protein [Mesorhizobium sp.]RWD71663.1 MAG: hypothetical protein EOS37_11195 [Mesorhizobium sp.]
MTDFNSNIVFLIAVISAVGGLWWRIEAAIKTAKSEAMTQASAASTAAALALAQLAEYKTHVAETYITKAGLREFRDEVMTGVRDLKGSVSTLHERMDRFIEGDKMVRRRNQGT